MATISTPFLYPMHAPYASLMIGAAITVTTTSNYTTLAAGSSYDKLDIIVKSVTFTPGSRDVGAINTLGTTQVRDLKRSDMSSVKFTVVSSAFLDSAITGVSYDHIAGYLWGDLQVVGSTTTYRATGGWKTSNERALKCLIFRTIAKQQYWKTGTNDYLWSSTQDLTLNNAFCSDIEFSMDAEGHQEATLTFKCLAADTYVETSVPA